MKTNKLFTILSVLLLSLLVVSCVKDTDFELPDTKIKVPPFSGTVKSVSDVIAASGTDVTPYAGNDAIEGYVVSSDEGGNFYKKIYIQNLDGTDGFVVAIDKSALYSEYPVGTKVQVRLKELSTALVDNKLQVGYGVYKNTSVGQIPSGKYAKHIINLGEKVELKTLTHSATVIKDLTKDKNINMLLTFKRVAFDRIAVGKTYHISANDKTYGTNYKLLDSLGNSVPFRTGRYAKFAKNTVPKEKVNVTGILTKYRNDYQFMVSTVENVEIINGTDGGEVNTDNFTPKTVSELAETFDGVTAKKDITLEGWYSEAVKGNRKWQGKEYNGNKFIQASAYGSKLDAMETWIVTPGLDLAAATNKNFTFDTQAGYSKNETLEVFVASDFDHSKGVASATWKKLDVTLATKSSKYSDFVNAGNIDLSSYSGTVHVAFKYTGNGSDASGTWRIDNVKFNYTADNNGENNGKTVSELAETFDAVTAQKDVTLEGWYSEAAKGNRKWQGKEYKGNKFIHTSAYGSKLDAMETWIVTPGLDLATATNKNFTFDSQAGYSKNETLEVFIASDFDQSKGVTTATWKKLDATLATKNSKGYTDFINAGNIDLSSYSGIVHVAFKYTGNATDATGSWRIDNVKFNYTPDNNGGNNGGSSSNDDKLLFSGSNFEDWNAFKGALNKYGVKSYATQSSNGYNNSKALHIKGKPSRNDYVFTTTVPANFSASGKTKITFYIKGTAAGKSISVNLHNEDKTYSKFNLGNVSTSDIMIEPSSSNSYSGNIDTKGKWIKVTLKITDIASKIATTKGNNLFGLKIGKGVDWDLLVDDINIE